MSITMANDLLELEIAFQAFAKTIIAALVRENLVGGDALHFSLTSQAQALRANEYPQAAVVLERLATFSVSQEMTALLMETPDNGNPH